MKKCVICNQEIKSGQGYIQYICPDITYVHKTCDENEKKGCEKA